MEKDDLSCEQNIIDIKEISFNNANIVYKKILAYNGKYIDLSNVEHCDSAGIAILIDIKQYKQKRQQDILYINPTKKLQRLSTFLKVSKLLFGN